jgi:undecaprenyl-diphosphatase
VSSSGHIALVPELLGWSYPRLDPDLRKAFEVALHAGTAAALLIALRAEVGEAVRELDGARIARHAASFAPPAAAAYAFERPIEERFGGARGVATAQVAGGLALALADTAGARRERRGAGRAREDAGLADALLLGVGQAAALVPGVSRNGATLTVARLRGFTRPASNQLSRHAALPIILAAAGLKGFRLMRRGLPAELRPAFAAGLAASFASTLASRGLVPRVDRARSYLPFAAYRAGLGAVALMRFRSVETPSA